MSVSWPGSRKGVKNNVNYKSVILSSAHIHFFVLLVGKGVFRWMAGGWGVGGVLTPGTPYLDPCWICRPFQGTHATGKTGKMATTKIPVRENTGKLEILPKHRENTGNLVCSSCKFPDPKGKRYFGICRKNSIFSEDLDKAVLCM